MMVLTLCCPLVVSFLSVLCVCVCVKELQKLQAEPSALPLVERLSQEVQELREKLVQQGAPEDQDVDLDQQDLVRDLAPHLHHEFGGGHQRRMGQYR